MTKVVDRKKMMNLEKILNEIYVNNLIRYNNINSLIEYVYRYVYVVLIFLITLGCIFGIVWLHILLLKILTLFVGVV